MSADDFFAGGSKSAKFDQMNVPVGGKVLSVGPERQQKDLDGNPLWWDAAQTQPKMQLPIEVQTDLRDPEDPADDGARTIYVKKSSQMQRAIGDAVRAAGQHGAPKVGGTLHVAWTGSEPASKRGYNDKKIYTARYTPPAQQQDAFFGGQPQSSAPAAQPAPQAQPQPAAPVPAQGGARPPWEQAPAPAAAGAGGNGKTVW